MDSVFNHNNQSAAGVPKQNNYNEQNVMRDLAARMKAHNDEMDRLAA